MDEELLLKTLDNIVLCKIYTFYGYAVWKHETFSDFFSKNSVWIVLWYSCICALIDLTSLSLNINLQIWKCLLNHIIYYGSSGRDYSTEIDAQVNLITEAF